MAEHEAENARLYQHAVNVTIAGPAKRPVVSLWCMDCLVTLREFDQTNSWDDMQQFVTEHRSHPSKRETLHKQKEADHG